jgi:23S rRNA (adenine2503-C2)-methyltransferase
MYDGTSRERIQEFKDALHGAGFSPTVRLTRGRDIAAACGQLAATA